MVCESENYGLENCPLDETRDAGYKAEVVPSRNLFAHGHLADILWLHISICKRWERWF